MSYFQSVSRRIASIALRCRACCRARRHARVRQECTPGMSMSSEQSVCGSDGGEPWARMSSDHPGQGHNLRKIRWGPNDVTPSSNVDYVEKRLGESPSAPAIHGQKHIVPHRALRKGNTDGNCTENKFKPTFHEKETISHEKVLKLHDENVLNLSS